MVNLILVAMLLIGGHGSVDHSNKCQAFVVDTKDITKDRKEYDIYVRCNGAYRLTLNDGMNGMPVQEIEDSDGPVPPHIVKFRVDNDKAFGNFINISGGDYSDENKN